ncbi:hypothetical protein FHG87_004331 [Trinorchestia longiramus]|nr:hypothetical protein FHG87_004331 [Trinorchestia longiramus]
MKSLKKLSWILSGSKDNLSNRNDDACDATTSEPNCEPLVGASCSSSSVKSHFNLSQDPAFGHDLNSVPFIDGTSRNVADAVCQTDPVFLPQAGYLQQQSCLSSEVLPVVLSNPVRESCETNIPNSFLAVHLNHSDLHLQSEPEEKIRSSPSGSERNSVSIPLSHLASDEATDVVPKTKVEKYKSPFTNTSIYSSCATRRTSLRSPSLWGNEKVTLNCLTSSPVDKRRKSYVTPTFGGNDENFKLSNRLSLQQSPYLWHEQCSTKSSSLKLLPEFCGNRIVEKQPLDCFSLSLLADKNDVSNKFNKIKCMNDLKCDHLSLPSIINSSEASHNNFPSNENLDDGFSVREGIKSDPYAILRDYVAGGEKRRLSEATYFAKGISDADVSKILSPCTETPSKPASLLSWGNNAKSMSSLSKRYSDTKFDTNSIPNTCSTSSNLGGSSSDQKRMSIIDARLKVMPDQLATARDAISRHSGDGEASEESARVLQKTITLNVASAVTEGGGAMAPPSPLLRSSKPPTGASPSFIIASLDKSILQIRDWLTVVEQMCRQQTVIVGDLKDIRTMTEKQRNVLRELEGKKPQLEDLVASADSLRDDTAKLSAKPQQSGE